MAHFSLVLVHDVVLASAEDAMGVSGARRASLFALDALEGDAEFLTRTCDCRTRTQAGKGQTPGLQHVLDTFG